MRRLRALLATAFLSWPDERPIGAERPAANARVRLVVIGLFALLNASLYFTFSDKQFARPQVIAGFFLYVEVSLLVSALLTFGLRRASPRFAVVAGTCAVLEVATEVVWIQLTGMVSSYFTLGPVLFTIIYRVVYGWGPGVAACLTSLVGYLVCFELERRGLLQSAPLFRSTPGGVYENPEYRAAAASVIVMSYAAVFPMINLIANTLSRGRQELAEARQQLRRAVDQAKLGRLTGTVLAGHAIEDLLGRGGMGEVYAARRQKDGAEVAIKLLHAHLGTEPEMRARFRREAEVVSRLPPDTVAAVHEFGTTDDGYDYIVMERLRGEDLGALLRRRERLPLDELAPIIERVAVALDAAHEHGVVHRDLKPQNIFLGAGDALDVRLLDFGVARLHELATAAGMTATAAVIGTPGYMAPEQATGGPHGVGPAADVFALGAVVYRALTGKPAFPARNAAAALFEAINHEPPAASTVVPGLSRDVDAVLALALAKRSEERYQRASELARDLAAAARGELPAEVRARAERLTPVSIESARTMTSVDG